MNGPLLRMEGGWPSARRSGSEKGIFHLAAGVFDGWMFLVFGWFNYSSVVVPHLAIVLMSLLIVSTEPLSSSFTALLQLT